MSLATGTIGGVASVLLQYPTLALFDGLGQLTKATEDAPRVSRVPFGKILDWLGRTPPDAVARHYVETFDLQRRCALYLIYYRYGDTRKRGMAMVQFKAAYRAAGLVPAEEELPDYLPMVLDFAAAHPRGEKLLRAHRADLDLLLRALGDAGSPYADAVAGVCAVLLVPRVRATTSPVDYVALILLLIVILTGIADHRGQPVRSRL